MMEYDDTSSGVIHSRGLRKGLSVLYAADKNFQEGAMYDAEETLLALLNLMHQQTVRIRVALLFENHGAGDSFLMLLLLS